MNQKLFSFSSRSILRAVRFLVLAVAILSFMSGCARPEEREPKTVTVLEPAEIVKFTLDGQLVTTSKDRSISPDGKYLLAAVQGKEADRVVAIPIDVPDPMSAAVSLYEADKSWTRHNLVQWVPIGWLSETECVFAVHGWQDQGPHKGERGTALYTGDISAGTTTLVSYLGVPEQGQLVDDAIFAGGDKVYIRIGWQFVEFDLESKSHRVIRDNLPAYYGLSTVAVSPKGDQIVYATYGEEKSGLYVVDVATGTERTLVETGESLSFYPSWSPDGKYIAMYTVYRVENSQANGVYRYDFIPGEDGPFPSGQEITVMTPDGTVLKRFTLEGQYLSQLYWLDGGSGILFLSGPVTFGRWGEVISAEYDSVWIAGLEDGEPLRIAGLEAIEEQMGEDIAYVFPVASLPNGAGALLNVAGAGNGSIWKVSPSAEPAKVADGWWDSARLVPAYLDSVVGIIWQDGESSLYLVGPEETVRLGNASGNLSISAYTDRLLIASSYTFSEDKTEVTVFNMVTEKVLE